MRSLYNCLSARRQTLIVLLLSLLIGALIFGATGCKYSAEQTLQRASDAWDSGDYELSSQLYELYLNRPHDADKELDARFRLGNIYYLNLHKYDQALQQYQAFLGHAPYDPRSPIARERAGDVLAELGRSYQAISQYENINPEDPKERRRIRLRIADLYFGEKNFSQALTEYQKLTDAAPYDEFSERAYLREASIYQLERSQYQQAIPIYQKVVVQTSDPKVRTTAMFAMSECYSGLYQFDQAVQTLRSIKDSNEQGYIDRRIAELETQKREQQHGEMTPHGPGRL